MADEAARQPPEPEHAHVSAEQVADLREGVLPDAEAATVAAHLDECAECAHLQTRLTELSTMLAAEPAPSMPPDVALRLDAALAEAAAERAVHEPPAAAGAGAPERPGAGAHPSPVTSLADRRRRFLTRAGTGLAAAAAVIIGVVVVGDVLDRDGDAADSTAGGSSEISEPAQDSGGESADLVRARPARLRADDFRAGVAGLLSAAPSDADRRGLASGTEQYARRLPTACSAAALRSAGIPGSAGPRALLDGRPVTLVTSGPPRRSLVTAYSCAAGQPVEEARTYVDLVR